MQNGTELSYASGTVLSIETTIDYFICTLQCYIFIIYFTSHNIEISFRTSVIFALTMAVE